MNKFAIKPIMFSLFSVFVAACTQASFFIVNASVKFEKEQVSRDIIFDEKDAIKLDVYKPLKSAKQNAEEKTFPVIVFFYGGAWQSGDKEQYEFVAEKLVSQGYVVVIPNYRKYPKVTFPAFIHDGAQAVAWVSDNIQNYSGASDKIFLMGHSAGAHTAALLAADKSYLGKQGVSYNNIKGVVGLSGPYDFTPKAEIYKKIFGPPENYPQMRVTNFIDGSEPPFYLIHGEKDKTVGKFNAENLVKTANNQGTQIQAEYYSDMTHIDTIAAFSWVKRYNRDLVDGVYAFLERSQKER